MARGESPYRDKLYSSPHQRSSPLRRESPARSPAQHDLEHLMDNLNLQGAQLKKVWIHQRNIFNDSLDARQKILADTDERMIQEALIRKKQVQDEATATLQAHLAAEAEEKRRRLEEERRRQEDEARRKAEAECQAREEEERRVREQTEREEARQRAEADRKRQEEEKQRKADEEAKRREDERKQQAAADQARKDADAEAARKKSEDDQKAKATAAAAAAAAVTANAPPAHTPQVAPAPAKATGTNEGQARVEQKHREYIALHRKLKQFRKDFWEQCKADKAYKGQVGDLRRLIKTSVGQLRLDGPQENKTAMAKVKKAITTALEDTFSPQIPVNDYLPAHAHVPTPCPTVPSLTIYLLSILSKAVMHLATTTCIDNPRAADAPGILVAQLFSMSALQFDKPSTAPHPSSLVSILLAKFHAAAPQLFGISASEKPTVQGNMLRLGWRREHIDNSGEKAFVPEQSHYDRLVAFGSLYAAIALRNFSKTAAKNPIPPVQFWESLSLIINTPGPELQVGQLVLLKHMLENSVDRIIQFWGATGVALVREAVMGVHSRAREEIKGHSAGIGLMVLKEKWAKERFHLD